MAGYSAVADASETLLELLRTELVNTEPSLDLSPEQIVLASPDELTDRSDVRLSVFPFTLSKDSTVSNQRRIKTGRNEFQEPPLPLSMQHLITAYPPAAASSASERIHQQQAVMGRVIQVMHDNAVIEGDHLVGSLAGTNGLKCTLNDKKNEQIEEIWRSLVIAPYQQSIVYDLGPVLVESERTEELSRVEERDIGTSRLP